jgi:hypothetical protein
MKLFHQERRFVLKDSKSLAFYNLPVGQVLEARASLLLKANPLEARDPTMRPKR